MMIRRHILMVVAAFSAATAFSQEVTRSSSSLYLPASKKADVVLSFALSAEGKQFSPTWGLDEAWISEQNLLKGINHMGKENVGIGRSTFRYTEALENDSVMSSSMIKYLRQRSNLFDKVSPTLPLVLTADQEAVGPTDDDPNRCPPEYYVKNKAANIEHWAAMINSHVHWMQANTKHPIVGISPFNEGDYWSVEEGSTAAGQWKVAKLLKENYPRCADVAMVGGNTLNNDKALTWYTSGKNYYDWGNTHQLAGSFDTFANFYQQLQKDGKVGYGDEMHNVGEAMIGLEYGMTVGIWWGFDSRARGEFCDISLHGKRLAYGEHRTNWTAASVYRHDDGRVKAFIGSSERQAATTNFQLVSTERDVYYDGYGPVRDFTIEMPGGAVGSYQKGQTNAERVIDVTWGEDVPPSVINGTYKIVNKKTGNVLAINNSAITQQIYKSKATQQWNVQPISSRIGGDYSFYDFSSVNNASTHINVRDFSTKANAEILAYSENKTPSSNEQWYLQYVGNGYYYIRNRESALYLASVGTATTNNVRVTQTAMQTGDAHDKMLWRFLPIDVAYETTAPAQPSGLLAEAQAASVKLSWNASTDDDFLGYMVLRSPKDKEDWNTIARCLTKNYFVDNTCRPGTSYIYKVKAIDLAQNLSEASATAEATPTGERSMLARWNMENNLYDDTPNMMDIVFCGTPTYLENSKSGERSLVFNGSANKYAQLPYEIASSDELTVSMWVYMRGSTSWQRLFDFGNDTEHYMFLTPTNGSIMRFAIKNGGDEQIVNCKTRLTTQQWKHVAVTIGKDKTVIYVDGAEAASSTGITIRPSDIHPTLNYLGRSQFASDPFLNAYLDDVRVYNYALSAEEIEKVMGDLEPSAINLPQSVESVPQIYGIDGVKRSTLRQGLNIVDGKKVIR